MTFTHFKAFDDNFDNLYAYILRKHETKTDQKLVTSFINNINNLNLMVNEMNQQNM